MNILLRGVSGFAKEKVFPFLYRIYKATLWFLFMYWRRLLLLFMVTITPVIAGFGWPQVYAAFAWLAILVIVDCVIAYKTADYWLWPVVRMIETSWYGKPLDKEKWDQKERKAFKKEYWFWFFRRRKNASKTTAKPKRGFSTGKDIPKGKQVRGVRTGAAKTR